DHRLVVGSQEIDEAVLLAGELAVEGALGRAGVPDDVGDRGVAVAAFTDRGVEAVEQPAPERAGLVVGDDGLRVLSDGHDHPSSLKFTNKACLNTVPQSTVLRNLAVRSGTTDWLGVNTRDRDGHRRRTGPRGGPAHQASACAPGAEG